MGIFSCTFDLYNKVLSKNGNMVDNSGTFVSSISY